MCVFNNGLVLLNINETEVFIFSRIRKLGNGVTNLILCFIW